MFNNKGSIILKKLSFPVFAGTSWYVAYKYFINKVEKSSSIVQQTLFNLNSSKISSSPFKIISNVSGQMNQFKGFANIGFEVQNALDRNHF